MKKSKNIKAFIKVILLSIVITYMVLNLVGIALVKTEYKVKLNRYIAPIIQGNITEKHKKADEEMVNELKQRYGESAPSNLLAYAQGYFLGQEQIINMQEMLIGISIIGGIIVGVIAKIIVGVINNRNKNRHKK